MALTIWLSDLGLRSPLSDLASLIPDPESLIPTQLDGRGSVVWDTDASTEGHAGVAARVAPKYR